MYKFDKDKERLFVAEETEGAMRVTIPDYAPGAAMNFLATKAYSRKSLSSMFRFFETIKGYFWVTDEWLLQEGKKGWCKSFTLRARDCGSFRSKRTNINYTKCRKVRFKFSY